MGLDFSGFPDVVSAASNLWYLWLGVAIIPCVIMGIFTLKTGEEKRIPRILLHRLFLQLGRLIYVVGLPLAKDCVY